MYPSNLVEPIDLLCNLVQIMSILDSFVAFVVFAMLLVVFLLFTLLFTFRGETTTNDIAKTHKPGNRLEWKLHKRRSKNPNVEVSEVYFYINSFILAYIRLK